MISKNICALFGYDNSVIDDYLKNKKLVSELSFLNSCKDGRLIYKMSENDKETFDLGYELLKEKRKDIKIDYQSFSRNKIVIDKQERKLFRYLNDSALSEEIGKYKLPNRDLYFVISINPEDMLLCSTGHPWTSCTNLEKGDYKFTTISNLFVNGRFIMYITDKKEIEYEGLKSFNMLFRAFGFVGKDGKLYGNIWYPIRKYININFLDGININAIDKEDVESKYNIDIVFNNYQCFTLPYLDYGSTKQDLNNNIISFSIKKEYEHFYPLTIFKNKKIIHTSNYFWFKRGGYEESLKKHCDCCGSLMGYIETIGDRNYCQKCKNDLKLECTDCGKKVKANDCFFTEDNKWICKECLELSGKRVCSICGTTIRMKNKTECKYCRSTKIDAFKNINYEYFDKESKNVKDYFRHYYIDDDGSLPPGIKEDEDFFENYEMYIKR